MRQETRGIQVSRSKTQYMCVNESGGSGKIKLHGAEVVKVHDLYSI